MKIFKSVLGGILSVILIVLGALLMPDIVRGSVVGFVGLVFGISWFRESAEEIIGHIKN